MFKADQPNYQGLRSVIAERTSPLVFWVGAGLSAAAGLPTWSQLKDSVCSYFRRHCDSLEDDSRRRQLELVEAIAKETDLWVAFTRLHEMGRTTFEEAIRKALERSASCDIPDYYHWLFKINAKGIITLNLDRLAARAFSMGRSGVRPVEFCGKQCADYAHALQSHNTFILNAHGTVDNSSSWILRSGQLNWLLADQAYLAFIQTVLMSHKVVFVGVSADDCAVTSHLKRLAAAGIRVHGHYWVTDRQDMQTHRWAEENGILIIRYSAANKHAELKEMLEDLAKYRPMDPVNQIPIAPCTVVPELEVLPSPNDLLLEPEEIIREKLNAHAQFILGTNKPSRYDDYELFRKKYDKCIHHCWYVDIIPPHNRLMGYELIREIAEGAFGRVFEAKSNDGKNVAVKLLREEVRRKPEMLQSFRRGVHAMRILSEHKVEGMVGYADCSEIPAFAVMDLINGPNLKQAVLAKYLEEWHDLLRFAVELTGVIRHAHQLPERVLHRDIRPANIMLKDYDDAPERSHVVVLDFDLSWYKEALEASITQGPAMHGYLAPELTDQSMKSSTRNAAVDSFGLGMTLYFMRAKADPLYMQHRHATWAEDVTRAIIAHRSKSWLSLPQRFADLILLCTRDNQPERCDVAYIMDELQRLLAAHLDPNSVKAADLLCHELAYRCCSEISQLGGLRWDYDRQEASLALASGVTVVLQSDENSHSVTGLLSWENRGGTNFKNVRKYLGSHAERTIAILAKSGYEITDNPSGNHVTGTRFGFKCQCGILAKNMSAMGKCLADALMELRLE